MSASITPTLTDLRTTIIALSANVSDASELISTLTRNETLLSANAMPLVESLSPKDHTVACLFILWCWSSSQAVVNHDFIKCTVHVLRDCDGSRIHVVSGKFMHLCRRLKSAVMLLEKPRLGVLALHQAAMKFAKSEESLTPLHVDFFQLCLLAKTYSAAESFLDCEFYDLDSTASSLTPTDYLLYCYYGGRLCIGLKRYSRALELFHLALVAPTLVANAITLLIYKLYVLVSLLECGSILELPRFASGAVMRLSRSFPLQPYLRLAEAYKEEKLETVQKIVNEFRDAFVEDNCLGLVKQIVSNLTKRDIKKLTKAYISLSLKDITSSIGLTSIEETELVLLTMVESNEINVEINSATGMVKFSDEDCGYDDTETALEIDKMLQDVIQLGERMNDVRDKIELDPEYRARAFQNKQHLRLDANDLGDRM